MTRAHVLFLVLILFALAGAACTPPASTAAHTSHALQVFDEVCLANLDNLSKVRNIARQKGWKEAYPDTTGRYG